jgi:hypothetical protein
MMAAPLLERNTMPRPALKNVSTTSLQAELARRATQLGKLLKLKEQVDKDIAELQGIAGQFGAAVAVPVAKVRRKRGRPAKVVKVVAKPAAEKGVRSQYGQTANEFILGLLTGGKVLTSQQLQAAWTEAGRKGKVSKTLAGLIDDKKLARRKIRGHKGSNYTVAGSAGGQAKPAAKKGKKTFTCPTCKKVFASGPMLGGHYKAKPTHRQK